MINPASCRAGARWPIHHAVNRQKCRVQNNNALATALYSFGLPLRRGYLEAQ
jgi:hypothetical protein